MKLPCVTIAIPAHNEEANIAHLLADILRQSMESFRLCEILVASDGSTDETNSLARIFNDERIKIFAYRERKGKAFRQNQMIEKTHSDILIILDADIVISDPQFLEKLLAPIFQGTADMTSGAIRELNARTFFEQVIFVSMKLKHTLFSSFKKGSNLYTCHGPARAFNRQMFSKLVFTVNDGEDMFSYLNCVSRNLRFQYVPKAVVDYRLPSTFTDHRKQSVRFIRAKTLMRKAFGNELVDQELNIPTSAYIQGLLQCAPILVRYPIHILTYLAILTYVKIAAIGNSVQKESWVVGTSKSIRV